MASHKKSTVSIVYERNEDSEKRMSESIVKEKSQASFSPATGRESVHDDRPAFVMQDQ